MIALASSLNRPGSPEDIARSLMAAEVKDYKALPIADKMDEHGAPNVENFLYTTPYYTDQLDSMSPAGHLIHHIQELALNPEEVTHITPQEFREGVEALRKKVAGFRSIEKNPWLSDNSTKSYLLVKAQAAVREYWGSVHLEHPISNDNSHLPEGIRISIGMAETEAELDDIAKLLMQHPKFIESTPISKEYLAKMGDKVEAARSQASAYAGVYEQILDASMKIAKCYKITISSSPDLP